MRRRSPHGWVHGVPGKSLFERGGAPHSIGGGCSPRDRNVNDCTPPRSPSTNPLDSIKSRQTPALPRTWIRVNVKAGTHRIGATFVQKTHGLTPLDVAMGK